MLRSSSSSSAISPRLKPASWRRTDEAEPPGLIRSVVPTAFCAAEPGGLRIEDQPLALVEPDRLDADARAAGQFEIVIAIA